MFFALLMAVKVFISSGAEPVDGYVLLDHAGIVIDHSGNVMWRVPEWARVARDLRTDGLTYTLIGNGGTALEIDADGRKLMEIGGHSHHAFRKIGCEYWALQGDGPALDVSPSVNWLRRFDALGNLTYEWGAEAYLNSFALSGRTMYVSSRNNSTILVIDLDAHVVVDSLTGTFRQQHAIEVLDDQSLALFDNGIDESHSSVIVLRHGQEVWRHAVPHSRVQGYVQEIIGGDLLVTETAQGKVVRVTRGGREVWTVAVKRLAGSLDQDEQIHLQALGYSQGGAWDSSAVETESGWVSFPQYRATWAPSIPARSKQ